MPNAGKALSRFVGWFYSGALMAIIAMAAGTLAAIYAPPSRAFAAFVLGTGLVTIWLLNTGWPQAQEILAEGKDDPVAWGAERFLPVTLGLVGGYVLAAILAGPMFKAIFG